MGLPPVPGRNNGGNNRNMAPLPPISTIPRPNTSMGKFVKYIGTIIVARPIYPSL